MQSKRCEWPAIDQRKDPRRPAETSAALRGPRVRALVDVVDLSTSGARVRTDHLLDVGDRVSLTLPLFQSVDCSIVWASRDEAGLRFDNRIGQLHLA